MGCVFVVLGWIWLVASGIYLVASEVIGMVTHPAVIAYRRAVCRAASRAGEIETGLLADAVLLGTGEDLVTATSRGQTG
jgi:hypothetical protein